MRYFLILNPGSHSGRGKRSYLKLLSILDERNINYEFKIPESFGEIIKISAEANKEGYDVIVAVGGDGTINNVINGFYDKNGKRISKARMGIIYTGTSPDFCKSYNIPFKNLNRAVEILLENEARDIQIGMIHFRENLNSKIRDNNQCELITRYFACCANIGLGATLADFANRGIRRVLGDLLGTLFSLFRTLIIYKPVDLEIISDDKSQIISRVFNISIGLTYYIASGI
ncbi:diacylglycerol kinase, partial [Candidatus Dependentiae bacterium]|nr:diacylglycerol kinase [Candidatus Dependentiae bacterium]